MNHTIQLTPHHCLHETDLSFAASHSDISLGQRVRWRVSNQTRHTFCGTLRLEVCGPACADEPWPLIPSVLYGDNALNLATHPDGHGVVWPRWDPKRVDPSQMVSSHWMFSADRVSAPMVYTHCKQRCLALAGSPHFVLTNGATLDSYEPQVGFGLSVKDHYVVLGISVPGCDEPYTYNQTPRCEPTIRRITLPPGASAEGECYLFDFAGDRHGYAKIIRWLSQELLCEHPPAMLPDTQNQKGIMADAVHGLIHHHYEPTANYFAYTRTYDRVAEQIANAKGQTLEWHQMQTGFSGGLPVCWGLAIAANTLGDQSARDVAVKVANRICEEGISPSGFFWADFAPGIVRTANGDFPNHIRPDGRDRWSSGWQADGASLHTRTLADACWSLGGLIQELPDNPSVDRWKAALRNNVETILDLQPDSGTYACTFHAMERRVISADGCGGTLWIPALLRASEVLEDALLSTRIGASTRRAAEYYEQAVRNEYLYGAPEDTHSASSEDGMLAFLAYSAMYRAFGDKHHLELARLTADWTLTFRKLHNIRLDPRTLLGVHGLRSRGGDTSSAGNAHLHIFECLCAKDMCELSDWLGDDYYRESSLEHIAFAFQYLSRVDGQFNGFRGGAPEQFYWFDASTFGQDTHRLEAPGIGKGWDPGEHHSQKGHICGFSTIWCVNLMIFAAKCLLDQTKNGSDSPVGLAL